MTVGGLKGISVTGKTVNGESRGVVSRVGEKYFLFMLKLNGGETRVGVCSTLQAERCPCSQSRQRASDDWQKNRPD